MNWLGSLGSLAVALGAVVLAHHLAIGRDKLNSRRNAAASFRRDVLAALSGLYPLPVNWPDDIEQTLRSAFPKLQTAIAEFRPFVPWPKRWAYDRAWSRFYTMPDGGTDNQFFLQYKGIQNLDERPTNPKNTFDRNVRALLAFDPTM